MSTDVDRKPVERIFHNLKFARAQHVQREEKHIVYGTNRGDMWTDIEADKG